MSYAVLFPGQGSQQVGMGADVFDAYPDLLGETADEILGWSLRDMCLDAPAEELTRTEHAQPALFAVSYALWSAFEEAVQQRPDAAAGHSLGEYTALAAAGVLSFESALSLVAKRGEFMAEAADAEPTGMAALMGADMDVAEAVVEASGSSGGTLQIANLNAPGQIVVAGSESDLEWLQENAGVLGVRRAIALDVAGAFHSSYMAGAAERLRAELETVALGAPRFDVVSNVTGRNHVQGSIADSLVDQVVSPVRFAESLTGLSGSGVTTFVHIGPGNVTAGLAKRTVPDANVYTVSSLDDVGSAAASLGTIDG